MIGPAIIIVICYEYGKSCIDLTPYSCGRTVVCDVRGVSMYVDACWDTVNAGDGNGDGGDDIFTENNRFIHSDAKNSLYARWLKMLRHVETT